MMVSQLPITDSLKKLLVEEKGIVNLYPPQEEAFRVGVLNGVNVVLVTPTASGKTLVAEVTMIENVIRRKRKTLYLVPLRAIAHEKASEFSIYEKLGIKVAVTTGDYDADDSYLEKYDIIVTTNEKADSLLRHNPKWIDDVGLLVVDEIHYLDDPKRGPVLESVIARLRQKIVDIQVIALSATVANVEEIAEWLNAVPVVSKWRPVPLVEGVFLKNTIYYSDGRSKRIRTVSGVPSIDLALDAMVEGGQTLIFANTRRRAVKLAEVASKFAEEVYSFHRNNKVSSYVEKMWESSQARTLNMKLIDLIEKGVAFHHAGLNYVQRKIIEEAFRNNVLKILVATPTLAAGVNLPARRVVIDSYKRYEYGLGSIPVKVMEYKQFAGRAGRPGYDEIGEAIIIVRTEREKRLVEKIYINSDPESIVSKLGRISALRSIILSLIASGGVRVVSEILGFIEKTLYYCQHGFTGVKNKVHDVIKFLKSNDMISGDTELEATLLGKRVSETYVDPLSAIIMINGLKKARPLTDELPYLHLLCSTPDMIKLNVRRKEYRGLEEFLDNVYYDLLVDPYELYDDIGTIYSTIKTALILYDWINEKSEDEIVETYDVGPGDLYSIIETAEWLLYSMIELAKVVGVPLSILKKLILVKERVKKGVRAELLPLTRLKGIGRVRARILYNHGYRCLDDLAKASIEELKRIPGIGIEMAKKIKSQVSTLTP